ncbi:TrkA C-terminal domain-containing protein [Peribacillus sp. SCS-155]|uniref:TrkA C-terminal domain-containing protein n=1 Tax=Peribacillus sedimenti TaxID=3115297 RepID=UPI00390580C9
MGFIFILLYFLIIALVIEVSVVLFNTTGMKTRVSRFQVISMLTGTGFTTDESKVILDHPVRRKIAAFLILFGAFSLAVIISSISNILADDLRITELIIIVGLLSVIFIILKTPIVKKKFSKQIDDEMEHHYQMYERPIKDVLFLNDEDLVTQVTIDEESQCISKKIDDFIDREDDISVLFINRGEIQIRKELYTTTINAGDQIYLYGNKNDIERRFSKEIRRYEKREEEKLNN